MICMWFGYVLGKFLKVMYRKQVKVERLMDREKNGGYIYTSVHNLIERSSKRIAAPVIVSCSIAKRAFLKIRELEWQSDRMIARQRPRASEEMNKKRREKENKQRMYF